MVLADPEDIETGLIGALDLLDHISQPLRCVLGLAGFVERRRETVNANLHRYSGLAELDEIVARQRAGETLSESAGTENANVHEPSQPE
jgi:hypothetical protein